MITEQKCCGVEIEDALEVDAVIDSFMGSDVVLEDFYF